MGYCALTPVVTVRVCARCPDSAIAEAEARRAGQRVMSSLCRRCYEADLRRRVSA